MKETSTVAREGREGQVGRAHLARVEALDHGHPRVLAQACVDLAVGDVDRGHPSGAALQQAVGEAAGRGADVEAVAAGDVDPERLERVLQLDAAARDVARPRVDEQRRFGLDQLAGPQRDRPVLPDPDFARPHGAGRRRARGEEPPLGQNRVYPGLLHRRNATAAPEWPNSPAFDGPLDGGYTSPPIGTRETTDQGLCDRPHTQIARMFVRCSRIQVEEPM